MHRWFCNLIKITPLQGRSHIAKGCIIAKSVRVTCLVVSTLGAAQHLKSFT